MKNVSQAKFKTPQRQLLVKLFLAALAMASLSGCGGPSQEELMMRAARRPRPAEESEPKVKTEPPLATAPQNGPPVSAPETAITATALPAAVDSKPMDPVIATPATEIPGSSDRAAAALAVDRRRPEAPLSDVERRQRSADNLRQIGKALAAYTADKGRLPLPASTAANGIAMLSWRVELLPYLGYEALYQKFELAEPWDSPHNRQLLDQIPACYISPERFDSSTNYLAVSGRRYLFNGKPVPLRRVEDGIDNTLAIVEVDDGHAVPWTRPADYAPEHGQLRVGMGHLRPEGIYALWGNGLPTLLAPDVGEQQLHRACTYESGDGLVASEIHTELAIQELQQADVAAAPAAEPPTSTMVEPHAAATDLMQPADGGNSTATVRSVSGATDGLEPRFAVPGLGDLAAATEQLEALYAERVQAATTVSQRRVIAQEMLAAALAMRGDPPGAYALQTAAMQISAAAGDVESAGEAVDAQVAMFEVDPLKQNGEMLELIGRASVGAGVVDGRAYLQRALPVLRQAIDENAYGLAEDLCKFAIQFESQSRDRAFLPYLNRLRLQIEAAGNQHRRVEAALAQLRKDPSDRAANSTVGVYLAFIKGDWQPGLNLLASGDNEQLARISAIDAATAPSATAMMTTADAWWDLGQATTQKQFRQASRKRAAFWYAKAMETMPESLARMHAQARIREAETSGASTPLEAISRIEVHLGVD